MLLAKARRGEKRGSPVDNVAHKNDRSQKGAFIVLFHLAQDDYFCA
jgi:hypothetical protein